MQNTSLDVGAGQGLPAPRIVFVYLITVDIFNKFAYFFPPLLLTLCQCKSIIEKRLLTVKTHNHTYADICTPTYMSDCCYY